MPATTNINNIVFSNIHNYHRHSTSFERTSSSYKDISEPDLDSYQQSRSPTPTGATSTPIRPLHFPLHPVDIESPLVIATDHRTSHSDSPAPPSSYFLKPMDISRLLSPPSVRTEYSQTSSPVHPLFPPHEHTSPSSTSNSKLSPSIAALDIVESTPEASSSKLNVLENSSQAESSHHYESPPPRSHTPTAANLDVPDFDFANSVQHPSTADKTKKLSRSRINTKSSDSTSSAKSKSKRPAKVQRTTEASPSPFSDDLEESLASNGKGKPKSWSNAWGFRTGSTAEKLTPMDAPTRPRRAAGAPSKKKSDKSVGFGAESPKRGQAPILEAEAASTSMSASGSNSSSAAPNVASALESGAASAQTSAAGSYKKRKRAEPEEELDEVEDDDDYGVNGSPEPGSAIMEIPDVAGTCQEKFARVLNQIAAGDKDAQPETFKTLVDLVVQGTSGNSESVAKREDGGDVEMAAQSESGSPSVPDLASIKALVGELLSEAKKAGKRRKNTIAARQSRARKQASVNALQDAVGSLTRGNQHLRTKYIATENARRILHAQNTVWAQIWGSLKTVVKDRLSSYGDDGLIDWQGIEHDADELMKKVWSVEADQLDSTWRETIPTKSEKEAEEQQTAATVAAVLQDAMMDVDGDEKLRKQVAPMVARAMRGVPKGK